MHDYPLVVRGEGVYLYDADGKQYLAVKLVERFGRDDARVYFCPVDHMPALVSGGAPSCSGGSVEYQEKNRISSSSSGHLSGSSGCILFFRDFLFHFFYY